MPDQQDARQTQEDSSSSHGYSDLGEYGPGPSTRRIGTVISVNSAEDADDHEDYDLGTRVSGRDVLKLKLDGSNYTEWRVVIVGALDANPYALAVAQGKLTPPTKDNTTPGGIAQRKKYETGNRMARSVLLSSIVPALAVSLFDDNVETVEA